MTKSRWILTQEAFEGLLKWLHSDRDSAGDRYEDIRQRLITIFTQRGCREPEDLADETINRVARKLTEIAATYDGDPALYFYGVAKKVLKESWQRRSAPVAAAVAAAIPPTAHPGEDERHQEEHYYECLEQCLGSLNSESRELILQYYQEAKQKKIENRKQLARRLGIAASALRLRACRIRAVLDECIRECIRPRQDELIPVRVQ